MQWPSALSTILRVRSSYGTNCANLWDIWKIPSSEPFRVFSKLLSAKHIEQKEVLYYLPFFFYLPFFLFPSLFLLLRHWCHLYGPVPITPDLKAKEALKKRRRTIQYRLHWQGMCERNIQSLFFIIYTYYNRARDVAVKMSVVCKVKIKSRSIPNWGHRVRLKLFSVLLKWDSR